MKEKRNNSKDKVTFKDLWGHPFYNSLIKLGMWVLFFIVLYVSLFLGSASRPKNLPTQKQEEEKQIEKISYNDMKKNLLSSELNIKYKIKDYYITGIIDNNTLYGTIEDNADTITKFKYDSEKIYQLKKDEEVENNEILEDIKLEYLLPSNIMKLIDNPKVIGTKSADELTYSYNIDGNAISVYLNDKEIEKIIILSENETYELEYKEVNNEKE